MNYGLIGNCSYSALLENGAVRWLCWPRMDSSFVFGDLLDADKGGTFSIEQVDAASVHQDYVEHTNVVRTVFRGASKPVVSLLTTMMISGVSECLKALMT